MERRSVSHRLRAALAVAITLITVAIGTTVAAPPAAAQCYGCDGVDPNTNGCSPATTVRELTSEKTGVRVELRTSGNCAGAWARSTQPSWGNYGTRIFIQANTGLMAQQNIGTNHQDWTYMLRSTRTLRACYGWGWNGPQWNDFTEFVCTSWW